MHTTSWKNAMEMVENCLSQCNGGAVADSEHIAGELMKRFKIQRPVSDEYVKKLMEIFRDRC